VSLASVFVLAGVWAIGGADPSVAGLVIILPSVAALMVLFYFVLREREAVGERLPFLPIRHKRLAQFLLFCVFIVPVLHLGFWLILLTVGLMALYAAIQNEWLRVRLVAVFDALMCLVLVGVMKSAGAGGDYYMARFLISVYCVFAMLLPCMVLFQDKIDESWFGRLNCFGYVVLALHAALIVLTAVSSLVIEAVKGPHQLFTEDSCIRSLVPSPTEATLTFMGSFAQSPIYEPAGPPANWSVFCTYDTTPLATAPPLDCDQIGYDWLGFWLLAGVYTVIFMWAWSRLRRDSRVSPDDDLPRPPDTGCRRSCRRCTKCVDFVVNNVVTVGPLAGVALALFVLGGLVLRCPQVDIPSMATSIAGIMPIVSVPTATTTTTTTFTSTSMTDTRSTTTFTSSTRTTTNINDTFVNITANTTTTTTTKTRTMTTSISTATRTTTVTNETVACPPVPVVELVDILSWTAPTDTGCQCGLNGVHGLWAPVAVPFEQLSQTWCEMGSWAPLLVGFFLYACHVLTLALLLEETKVRVEKEKEIIHRAEMDLRRIPPESRPKREKVLPLFEVSEREPRPVPVAGGGTTRKPRVFMV